MYVELYGDLFAAPFDFSLAHCVAKDFRMSRGIANRFRLLFGNVKFLKNQKTNIGDVAFIKVDQNKYIFYLVTKQFSLPNCKPTLEALRNCLKNLKKLCKRFNISKLAIPKIGCGIDSLCWSTVSSDVRKCFESENVCIRVYKLK